MSETMDLSTRQWWSLRQPLVWVVLLLLVLAVPHAQAEAPTAEKLALATRLIGLTGFEASVNAVLDQQAKLMRTPQAQDAFAYLRKNLDIQKLKNESAELMAELYTDEELKVSLEFYDSPIGRSIVAKQSQFRAAIGPLVQRDVRELLKDYQAPVRQPAEPGAGVQAQHG